MRGARPERALELSLKAGSALRKGERILVACSGGPDSIALTGLLAQLPAELGVSLALGHVNHGLRPSAWQDEAVVLRVGAVFDLPVDAVGLPELGSRGEAALRQARYRALVSLASKRGAKVIATAHTAEDQTETLLLALFRGTGLEGLSGMPERRPLSGGIDLARPLLGLEHETLRRYCHRSSLPYALDPGNARLDRRRNAVRAALEALRPAFPGLDRAVARAAEVVRREAAGEERGALRRRVRDLLRENNALSDVSFIHIESAVNAIEGKRSGRFFMSRHVELNVRHGDVEVRRTK